jgi:hypothetical protein
VLVETTYVLDKFEDLDDKYTTGWYNWEKNFLVPWLGDDVGVVIRNYGVLDNVEVSLTTGIENFENMDFIFIRASAGHHLKLSPWGPIHLLIVLGALIYVRKRWD